MTGLPKGGRLNPTVSPFVHSELGIILRKRIRHVKIAHRSNGENRFLSVPDILIYPGVAVLRLFALG